MEGRMSMINPEMWVNSVRSSGYRDAAMALGELIDNSIQAGASEVEVLVMESLATSGTRRTWQVQQIAVLDNGKGMDALLLQRALRFGDGEHHKDGEGMGKFGVGLPQASISQAKRIDAWSWQNGVGSAKHTFIDLSDPDWVKEASILPADEMPIPGEWLSNATNIGETGTLILWSQLDRLAWKKAETIFNNSDFLVGRMYRNWLTSKPQEDLDQCSIRLTSFDANGIETRGRWTYSANDPMYLLQDNSANPSSETGRKVLFESAGSERRLTFVVTDANGVAKLDEQGKAIMSDIVIRCSMAPNKLREAFEGKNAGLTDYGKHAKKNIGVSVMRAQRELTLSTSFDISKDPRNRWWGISVEFGPEFDDVLGVTNNKQDAENLATVAKQTWEDVCLEDETHVQAKERMKEENYPQYVCLEVASRVNKEISIAMKLIGKSTPGKKKGKKRHEDSPERRGTEATKERIEDTGKKTENDEVEEELTKEEKMEKIQSFLENLEIDAGSVEETLGEIIASGLKYSINHAHMDNDAFFTVDSVGGAILITLNRNHVAFNELFSSLETDTKDATPQQLDQLIMRAHSALMLMLISWARLEDEASGGMLVRLQDTRKDWGRIARDFLMFGRE